MGSHFNLHSNVLILKKVKSAQLVEEKYCITMPHSVQHARLSYIVMQYSRSLQESLQRDCNDEVLG